MLNTTPNQDNTRTMSCHSASESLGSIASSSSPSQAQNVQIYRMISHADLLLASASVAGTNAFFKCCCFCIEVSLTVLPSTNSFSAKRAWPLVDVREFVPWSD